MAIYITKPWYAKSGGDGDIYGAEWTIGSSPAWTRTDAAVGFSDPNPYYSSMIGSPSSPFDNISPWKDLQIVEDSAAGTLVEIPKFYYKWTRTSGAMKLQISMSPFSGSHVSPAHADRGDGVGERDYAYVGRYHCAETTYKSTTGVTPDSDYFPDFRTEIHGLGNDCWVMDFAMYWTINMLYLVEYANWDAQSCISYGCGTSSATKPTKSGTSDSMSYHTGIRKSSRSTYATGSQYRYIEDWWGNLHDFIDGIRFDDSNIYCIKNPADFSSITGGTLVGTKATSDGYIKEWTNPTEPGFEYALYPSAVDNNLDGTTYACDYCTHGKGTGKILFFGGSFGSDYVNRKSGPFYLYGSGSSNYFSSKVGARLMVLPSSRIS